MQRDRLFKITTISIIYVWLLLFAVAPLVLVLIFSFLQHDNSHFYLWQFTLQNYKTLFSLIYLNVFWRSIVLSFWVTLICLILGYPFAYFLTKLPNKIKPLLTLLVIVPFWTSSLLRTYAIVTLIQANGIISSILLYLHIIKTPLQLLYTNFAVIIGLVYNLLPFVILPLFANMEKMDSRLVEAAQDLGASKWTTFYYVILPLTRAGIFSSILITFLPAITLFFIPDLLGGAKSLLVGNLIQMQFLQARNWPLGSASSLLLSVMMSILLWFYFRAIPKHERDIL